MNAKEFLRQYKDATVFASKCEAEYQAAVENIDAIGSTLSGEPGMPHGTGISKKTEDKAIDLVVAREKWAQAIQDAYRVRQEVVDMIIDIPDIEGQVLYSRYIELLQWEQVAEKLHYSYTGIHYAHQRALNIVERRLNGEREENE